MLLKLLSHFISEVSTLSREESRSYECGFEHNNLSRVPFSLRYFLLTLVFLLFDLEVVLILFVGQLVLSGVWFPVSVTILLCFLFVLFLGLCYEWSEGSLDWLI